MDCLQFNHCVCLCVFSPGSTDLEREVEELRVQLGRISVFSEMEELKKCVERKDREKTQLAFQVEVCVFIPIAISLLNLANGGG